MNYNTSTNSNINTEKITIKKNLLRKITAVFVFMAIAAGIFYLFYFNSKEQKSDESVYLVANIKNEPIKNYEVRKKEEGLFLVNEQARFILTIPAGWNVEMIDEDGEVELLSPDMIGERGLFPSRGCAIRTGISHFTQSFPGEERRPQDIKKQIAGDSPILEGVQKIVTINNKSALKTFRYKDSEHGRVILVELPVNNTIYHFGIIYSLISEDECLEKFNQLIDSVSID